MVRRRHPVLWAFALVALCIAGFAGAAVAGNPGKGGGNGNGNGNSANAPGQQKKQHNRPPKKRR